MWLVFEASMLFAVGNLVTVGTFIMWLVHSAYRHFLEILRRWKPITLQTFIYGRLWTSPSFR